ncbi:ABC transporter substrate-binding protein [Thermus thermamylovorans]|uniref:Amino acid ABC transporter substrate-binding protein n=1 Tax=Thermus thermamylovorans TaxID=2509362 RepID=A0A4Q9B7S2_9DEIN|nr:ABC transporter substrate-binding protein [Thermus thermamylovorans]TBH21666.1 amino acid ABC transporter substrate-binding protein [Thermus thermamylovorans]
MREKYSLAKRTSRRGFLKAGLGLAVLGMARAQGAPPVVRVGTLFDYTGALAEFGPPFRRAADLAARQINEAARAVFGGPIMELVHEDSGTTASIGIDRARKLVGVDRVPAIVGSLASGVTVPVAEAVTVPGRVLQISPASTSPLITALPDNDYLFRTTASDALQGIVAAQLARGEIVSGHRFDTASTIFVNNPYGRGLSEVFARAFERRGGRVLAQVAHPEEPQPTYRALLERALAGRPGVLLCISYPGQATVYLREALELFRYNSFQFVDGTKSEEILRAVGAANLEGRLGTAPGSDPQWEGFQRFVRFYQEAYGERPPLPFMDSTYDAVAVIGLAIAHAVSFGVARINGTVLRDRLRLVSNPPGERVGVGEFRRAFELLRNRQVINYTGAAGEVDFDENGDVITPVEVWRYRGGRIEQVALRRPGQIPRS